MILVADVPAGGKSWAVVDASAHHIDGKVADRRFAAFLTPFRNEPDARAALAAAGGLSITEYRRKAAARG